MLHHDLDWTEYGCCKQYTESLVAARFDVFYFNLKTIFIIGSVFDNSQRTIGFHNAVLTIHSIAVTGLLMRLLVSRVRIFYAIYIGVIRFRLKINYVIIILLLLQIHRSEHK